MNEATKPKRWDEIKDEDIDLSDIPELGERFFRSAQMSGPLVQKNAVLIDQDTYAWFERQSPEFIKRINTVLRDHMNACLATSGGD